MKHSAFDKLFMGLQHCGQTGWAFVICQAVLLIFSTTIHAKTGAEPSKPNRETTIRMACAAPPNSPLLQHVSELYNQSLNPFGIVVNVVSKPLAQELKEFQEGTIAASCLRVKDLQNYTDIRGFTMVNTPSYNGKYYAVLRSGLPREQPTTALRTAVVKGHLYLESLLRTQGNRSLILVDSDREALELLKQNQADRAILWEVGLNEHRKLIELSDLLISHLYLSLPLHAAFADRHADIAQLLNRRLGAVREKLSEDVFKFQLSPQQQFEVTLVMACHIPAQSELAKWLLKIYQRTFDRLHYNLELRIMSRQRAMQELRAGRIDLDCARTRNFADIVGKSAIIIPAQVGETALSVYSQSPGDRIDNLQVLTSGDRLTHVRGSVFVEDLIERHGLKSHPTLNARASLKMLISDRADYYFGFIDDTELAINRALLQDHIHNRGTLLRIPVYMYIHARHQKLIPEIAEAFNQLNGQGPWLRPEATRQSL